MDRAVLKTIPEGLEVRSNTIRLHFMLSGIRCRESVKLEATRPNLKYCANLRAEILNKIARNEFDYSHYFPNSKFAKRLGIIKDIRIVKCSELLEQQLINYAKMVDNGYLSPSTLAGYRKIITGRLIPELGDYLIQNLTSSVIRQWLSKFDNTTEKTITNYLTPLRHMLDDALNNELITTNPMEGVAVDKLLRVIGKKSEFEVNPLTETEKQAVLNAADGQIKNLFQFGFWSGLRTSELIALKWADIDLKRKIANIHQAKVCNVEKCTKTKSGIRDLVLLPKALEALENQINYTGDSEYVFHNPNTNQAWANSNKVSDVWRKLLLGLNIPYRNCYQMRHTYASTLLSNGENIFWVANQMGHKDIDMLIKHYGRWIPKQDGYKFVGDY
ncbi:MAG: hypothetical protein QG673_1221 [Pseudomonadota bacterium]|nr:hypothetical protein [Pseudomonadota bacterium]